MQKNSLNEIFQRIGEKTFLRTVKKESIHSPQAADFCYFMPEYPFPLFLPDTEPVEVSGVCRKYFVQRLSSKVYRPCDGQKKQDRLRVNFSLQLIENVVLTDYRHFTCRRCTKSAIFCTKSAISFEKFVVFLHFQIYVLWRNGFRL